MRESIPGFVIAEPAGRPIGWRRAGRAWSVSRLGAGLARNAIPALASLVPLTIIFVAVAAPWLAPYPPKAAILAENLQPPFFMAEGALNHWLGTDVNGNDILTDLMYGARLSLAIASATVALGASIGVVTGLVAGFYGRFIDEILMRLVDVILAFPILLLAILVLFLLGRGVVNVILVLSFVGWIPFARLVRGEVLSTREKDYVVAARAIGAGNARIMFRHILPNVVAPAVVLATFAVPQVIIIEAALSFLGLGVPITVPSWGAMLASGRDLLAIAPWVATFPGLAIMLTTLSINILGDWIRDKWDPRLRNV
ncbi:MAG: ABC transporter permease [Chloroflexi bacterium]|nr:ABC transporter permease [Chloroflexota bacterium]